MTVLIKCDSSLVMEKYRQEASQVIMALLIMMRTLSSCYMNFMCGVIILFFSLFYFAPYLGLV
jgi:hypothetical protein